MKNDVSFGSLEEASFVVQGEAVTAPILEVVILPISALEPAPYNPRTISPAMVDTLANAIVEFGFVAPVVVNGRNANRIVGGHARVEALRSLGRTEVPCIVLDLDDRAEATLNLALNKIGGEWNLNALRDVLEFIDAGDGLVDLTGFDEDEIERLMTAAAEAAEAITVPDVPTPTTDPVDVTAIVRIPVEAWSEYGERLKALVDAAGGTLETM